MEHITKRLIFIALIVVNWFLFAFIIVFPKNRYDWMQEMSEGTNYSLPIDDDSPVVVGLIAFMMMSLSGGAILCKDINAKIRILLALPPFIGAMLKLIW